MKSIFLDMDGVLMDFDRGLIENGLFVWSKQPGNRIYHHLHPNEWTAEEQDHDSEIAKLMSKPEFWNGLQPMSDAHLLWTYARGYDTHVLTAKPRVEAAAQMVSEAKISAIHRFFDPIFPVERINICLRKEKALFAANGNILVDDLPSNCEEWNAAGGTAILHTNAMTTINILSEIIHA